MIADKNTLEVGNWVITSKGRYGRVLELDISTMAAQVKIGEATHWICMDQLSLSKDGCLFKVTYVSGYDEKVQQVFIKRNTKLFDITDRTADMYEVVKSALIKIIDKNCHITITKIEVS